MAPILTLEPTKSCASLTKEERAAQIVAQIAAVSDLNLLRNTATPQAKALKWLIEEDVLKRCPDDVKLIQRWALATFYYSTGGEDWFECSGNPLATDDCGANYPFIGDDRFLSGRNECFWAGVKCNPDFCVTEMEYGEFSLLCCFCACIALTTHELTRNYRNE